MSSRLIVFILIVFFGFESKILAQDTLTLTVIVSGARPGTGQAMGSLFNSSESFLKEPLQEAVVTIDEKGSATLTFEGLSPATYAVSVIYDEDSDNQLDTGFLGIPTELIAMSNNARGRFGPPGFDKTKFDLGSSTTIEIRFGKAKE